MGDTVALAGNYAVAGCRFDTELGSVSGAVYVFDTTTGAQLYKLIDPNGEAQTRFGWAVAAQGNHLLIGAPNTTASFDGAAFLYDLPTGQYVRQWNGAGNELFGRVVGIEGSIGVIGTPLLSQFGGMRAVDLTTGAVLYDVRGSGVDSAEDFFPSSVNFENGLMIVGAVDADIALPGTKTGAAWIFDLATGQELDRVVSPTPNPSDLFGYGTALASGEILVGASDSDGAGPDAGSVFRFGAPDPTIYCTAKTNSLGCVPAIAINGVPSTSFAPFDITVSNVLNNKNGLLFYGHSGAISAPLLGGTLCVAPPLRRTLPTTSGGNPPPNDCSGLFTFDFVALAASGSDPQLVSGASVNAQWWSRDPGHVDGTGSSLSDAVQFELGP